MLNCLDNLLTYESIDVLISNLISLVSLSNLRLEGNEIGDEGMKILSPHLRLLIERVNDDDDFYDFYGYYHYELHCSSIYIISLFTIVI